MNKEKLVIRNFGPIKSVDLDLGKITVLIGDQASGKSTIAKVLAICRYFSYIVNYSVDVKNQNQFHENEQFFKGLADWGIEEYLKYNSGIIYENSLYRFEFSNSLKSEYGNIETINNVKVEYFSLNTRIESRSSQFTDLLNQLGNLKLDDETLLKNSNVTTFGYSWSPNENFYRLNVKKVIDNPLFIPAERGFQSLSIGRDSLLPDAIIDELGKINKIVRGYNIDIDIKPLDIVFRNENSLSKIKKSSDEKFYLLHTGASGYQSTIPVYLAVKFNNDLNTNKGRTIIVEEPELNLFPKTQKKLVEFFAESINQFHNQFILPTHSPYILTTLSNLIYAHKVGTAEKGKYKKEVNDIISEKSWIDVNDISVYYLNDGKANSMVNVDECIIDLDNLDNVSEVINKEFDELLNIENEYCLNE